MTKTILVTWNRLKPSLKDLKFTLPTSECYITRFHSARTNGLAVPSIGRIPAGSVTRLAEETV